jgi:hypothetical protein
VLIPVSPVQPGQRVGEPQAGFGDQLGAPVSDLVCHIQGPSPRYQPAAELVLIEPDVLVGVEPLLDRPWASGDTDDFLNRRGRQ